jgi:hypothetical protein
VHNRGHIVHVAHQVVVLHTWPGYADRIDFLKSIGSDQMKRHLSGDHHDWRRVHVSVRNSGDRISCAGTGGDQGHTNFSGRAGITFGHMNRALLVTHQVMSDSIPGSPELVIDMQHGATGITENRINAFMDQSVDQNFGAARKTGFSRLRVRGCGLNAVFGDHGC